MWAAARFPFSHFDENHYGPTLPRALSRWLKANSAAGLRDPSRDDGELLRRVDAGATSSAMRSSVRFPGRLLFIRGFTSRVHFAGIAAAPAAPAPPVAIAGSEREAAPPGSAGSTNSR